MLNNETKGALAQLFGPTGAAIIIIFITALIGLFMLESRTSGLRNEVLSDIRVVAERELIKVVGEQQNARQEQLDQWRKDVDNVVAKLARYDFLREYQNTEATKELEVSSLEKVHGMVTRLFGEAADAERRVAGESGRARRDALQAQALGLVRIAIDKKIAGDHDDYHNMATELSKQDFPQYALAILEEGMRRFPNSPDLIGSSMQYAVNSGSLEKAQSYFEMLKKVNLTHWNWRAFTFAVKYQVVRGDDEAARKLYDEAIQHLPDDERAAVQYAELFQRRGQTASAMTILEETIKRVPTAPQAALRLTEFYKSQHRYRAAVDMGRKALAMDALDQSRINNAATHLAIGLAGEQLWVESLKRSTTNAAERESLLRGFLAHYAAALNSSDNRSATVGRAVSLRKSTVQGYLIAQGMSQERVDRLFKEMGVVDKMEELRAMLNRMQQGAKKSSDDED